MQINASARQRHKPQSVSKLLMASSSFRRGPKFTYRDSAGDSFLYCPDCCFYIGQLRGVRHQWQRNCGILFVTRPRFSMQFHGNSDEAHAIAFHCMYLSVCMPCAANWNFFSARRSFYLFLRTPREHIGQGPPSPSSPARLEAAIMLLPVC